METEKSKHTPGPWSPDQCERILKSVWPNNTNNKANAAIIAAAPDMAARIKELEEINAGMLAALENLLAEFVHVPGDTEGNKDRTTAARIIGGPNAALARAREAIEKAKGE